MSAPRYERGEDMVRDADTAMYRAKALGKARCEIFDTSMLAAVEQRLQLESDLRHALARNELRVYYQPIVTLSEGQLCGFEALLRWHHPTQGVISPDAFIPVAEETGLIVPIGNWVLQESCRQMRAWDREFPEYAHLMINVNLSARQCMDPNLVRDVDAHPHRDRPGGAAAEAGDYRRRRPRKFRRGGGNPDGAADARRPARPGRLRDGLFGAELSAAVPVPDAEDRPLVRERDGGEGGNTEIIRAIVSLAAGLAMNVTAEGVETEEQLGRLKDLACEFGQGFYFYKPLAREDAHAVLESRKWTVCGNPVV